MQSIFNRLGFPIRKSADQFIFADPRGLSQLITSFFASESQGIPRVPFLTFFYHYRLLLGKVCFFYSDRRSLVHWFISSLVLLPMYLWSCDPLKPTTVLSVVFSFITSSNMSKNVLQMCRCVDFRCADDFSFAYLHIFSFAHSHRGE